MIAYYVNQLADVKKNVNLSQFKKMLWEEIGDENWGIALLQQD